MKPMLAGGFQRHDGKPSRIGQHRVRNRPDENLVDDVHNPPGLKNRPFGGIGAAEKRESGRIEVAFATAAPQQESADSQDRSRDSHREFRCRELWQRPTMCPARQRVVPVFIRGNCGSFTEDSRPQRGRGLHRHTGRQCGKCPAGSPMLFCTARAGGRMFERFGLNRVAGHGHQQIIQHVMILLTVHVPTPRSRPSECEVFESRNAISNTLC